LGNEGGADRTFIHQKAALISPKKRPTHWKYEFHDVVHRPNRCMDASKVLLVDDDKGTLAALGDLLSMDGYAVQTAGNGEEALSLLLRNSNIPDLIILDLFMPVLNGWEFLDRREDDPRLKRIPVMVISAVSTSVRADAIVRKPIDLRLFFETVPRLIRAGASTTAYPHHQERIVSQEVRDAEQLEAEARVKATFPI
jgi:CheY-like chemotaxis protein